MIAARHNHHQHPSFIDQSGWEVNEETTLNSHTLHAHFLKSVEDHARHEVGQKRRRSRYQLLYKERQKLRQAHRDNSQTIAFPEIYPPNPQFLTLNTLDLANTPRKVKWHSVKQNPKLPSSLGNSLLMQPRKPLFKDSPRRVRLASPREETGIKMVLQHKPGELIDDLASKHLEHYLRQRKEEHLRTKRGIFQLPLEP